MVLLHFNGFFHQKTIHFGLPRYPHVSKPPCGKTWISPKGNLLASPGQNKTISSHYRRAGGTLQHGFEHLTLGKAMLQGGGSFPKMEKQNPANWLVDGWQLWPNTWNLEFCKVLTLVQVYHMWTRDLVPHLCQDGRTHMHMARIQSNCRFTPGKLCDTGKSQKSLPESVPQKGSKR